MTPAKNIPQIVSVSRRSDIPALYMPWFMARLKAGVAAYRNPFFPSQPPIRVSLAPQDIAAWVFWSKNYQPFLPHAREIAAMGRPALLHFTINNYPGALEPLNLNPDTLTKTWDALAEHFDSRGIIWRYDPLILTSITPMQWHIENFALLAQKLEGRATRIITSVVSMYRKTQRRLREAADTHGFTLHAPGEPELLELLTFMRDCAGQHGMEMQVCSSPQPEAQGFKPAACIDPMLLVQLGMPLAHVPKLSPTREGCRCVQVRDIGAYDTCALGCRYCYAVNNHATAVSNLRRVKTESLTII